LFFTTRGRVFQLKVYEIPQASRTAKGQAIVNFLQLGPAEKVSAVLPVSELSDFKYLFMTTKKGLIKKVELSSMANIRRSGLIIVKLKNDDLLEWVKPTTGQDEIILVSTGGQAIRFKEKDVRAMGRNAAGVRGMRLKSNDFVIGMDIIDFQENISNLQLLVISENGLGKRTGLKNYKIQHRGGSGLKTAKITTKTGLLISSKVINAKTAEGEDVIIVSRQGQVIRLPMKSVSILGRATQGVKLMRFKEERDKVASLTFI
jgi:DNA gyrase subunit A